MAEIRGVTQCQEHGCANKLLTHLCGRGVIIYAECGELTAAAISPQGIAELNAHDAAVRAHADRIVMLLYAEASICSDRPAPGFQAPNKEQERKHHGTR